ncbi:hypothetical protein DIPPA_31020, partial [Diplonema papillatum]
VIPLLPRFFLAPQKPENPPAISRCEDFGGSVDVCPPESLDEGDLGMADLVEDAMSEEKADYESGWCPEDDWIQYQKLQTRDTGRKVTFFFPEEGPCEDRDDDENGPIDSDQKVPCAEENAVHHLPANETDQGDTDLDEPTLLELMIGIQMCEQTILLSQPG